jgi:hypothetical protein
MPDGRRSCANPHRLQPTPRGRPGICGVRHSQGRTGDRRPSLRWSQEMLSMATRRCVCGADAMPYKGGISFEQSPRLGECRPHCLAAKLRAAVSTSHSASRQAPRRVVGWASPGRGQGSPRETLRPAPSDSRMNSPAGGLRCIGDVRRPREVRRVTLATVSRLINPPDTAGLWRVRLGERGAPR